jgi:hypothetical protein
MRLLLLIWLWMGVLLLVEAIHYRNIWLQEIYGFN